MSANHASICVQDVLHPALLPYPFVYSPITLRYSRHVFCSAIQLFHIYALYISSLSGSSSFSALRETHPSKDLQRTGGEGLTGSLAYSHWMPMHSKLGLNSFWILALIIDLLALSILAKIGKTQMCPYQTLKVKWLSWVAFIWIAASEINLTKRVWYIGNFRRKSEFWDHQTGGTPKVIKLSSYKWRKLWKDATSKTLYPTFATHTHQWPQNTPLTYSKLNVYITGDQNLQCYKQN